MTLFWLGLIALFCYTVSLYAWPFKRHGRCKGTGRNRGSTQRRFGDCPGCGGTGRVPRIGAKFIHGSMLRIAADRRKARERRGKQKGQL